MIISVESEVYVRGYCDECEREFVFGPVTLHTDKIGSLAQSVISALASKGLNIQEDGTWKCWGCIANEDSERGITEETPSM
jgi:hypothetical protein